MSLQITEKNNQGLSLHNSKNNLDQVLANDIPEPLPDYSGFSMLICGASGSGKTTALYSIMSAKKKEWRKTIIPPVFSSHLHRESYDGE